MNASAVEIAPGHRLIRGWLTESYCPPDLGDRLLARLVESLPWEQRSARIFGKSIPMPRLICGMGEAYGYSGQRHAAAPIPAEVAALRSAIQAETGAAFDSVLANLYRTRLDSIAWHSDDEPELGPEPTIASLSLGAARRLALRPKHARSSSARRPVTFHALEHGDLLVMSGRSQAEWEHSIPKEVDARCQVGHPRVNVTFRRIVR